MNQTSILELIGILITFFSTVIALWQYIQKRRIKSLIALEAVELHLNVAVALGAIQSAKNDLLKGVSPSLEIGRTEGVCNSILHESAKLYCNLKGTKIDDINDLISAERLPEKYKQIYYSYSTNKRGWISAKLKDFFKLF